MVGTTGDPPGTRGDGGKQFVNQIVDRDQLKITTRCQPTGTNHILAVQLINSASALPASTH